MGYNTLKIIKDRSNFGCQNQSGGLYGRIYFHANWFFSYQWLRRSQTGHCNERWNPKKWEKNLNRTKYCFIIIQNNILNNDAVEQNRGLATCEGVLDREAEAFNDRLPFTLKKMGQNIQPKSVRGKKKISTLQLTIRFNLLLRFQHYIYIKRLSNKMLRLCKKVIATKRKEKLFLQHLFQ